jgi:hypothetical protein
VTYTFILFTHLKVVSFDFTFIVHTYVRNGPFPHFQCDVLLNFSTSAWGNIYSINGN